MLVELCGDEYPVTLPVAPSALAATDLAALAKSQHPDTLGPSIGSWQLQDPRVSEGDTTVLTLRSASMRCLQVLSPPNYQSNFDQALFVAPSGTEMATAFKDGTLGPTDRLFLVWSSDNDDEGGTAEPAVGYSAVPRRPPTCQ